MDFVALAEHCAPGVHPQTMAAVAKVESGLNPLAIGVVGGRLVRQPAERNEAVATAKALDAQGFNFSLGAVQVNRRNLARYGLDYESAFDACSNLKAGAAILSECYARAGKAFPGEQAALRAAFSCYYSGNFSTGFREGYVAKVVANADQPASAAAIPVVRAAPRSAARPGHHGADAREPSPRAPGAPGGASQATSALLF